MERDEKQWTEGPFLRFFGRVMASISHEIKNDLAVMAECAGLLKDLTEMAERKGAPPDGERVKTLASRITGRIQKADATIKSMNRFSHSVDQDRLVVDLEETLSLLVALAARTASQKGVALELVPCGRAVSLTTAPFVLMHLLWRGMEAGMEAAGRGGGVRVFAEPRDQGGALIRVAASGGAFADPRGFAGPEEARLLAILGARVAAGGANEIALELPGSIGDGK